ncbi:MAG: aminopeptidase [Chitinivibrionales bacterium]|nr:aminopeptidase [Chitinivibrionales bacterium]MBD3358430.1 aminopeptidase [Chitinivibrionales bacterium]
MYTPPKRVLKNYADILVNFALNDGKGIKKKDVVYLGVQIPGLPLGREVYRAVLAAGGYPILNIMDDRFKLLHLENASRDQLLFFPDKYYRGLADTADHWVRILAEENPTYLKKTDPKKIMLANRGVKPFREWLDRKEDEGRFSWTLCLYGTEGMAKEAGLSVEEYWRQIENACFLRAKDPLARWREVFTHMKSVLAKINDLPVERLHITAPKTDLWITMGRKRRWLGGSGRNIPSFEIFTSPDWRGTEGKIFFDLPLYHYGNIVKDIALEFRKGKIVNATARKGERLLHELIAQKNADKIGEFSLTDRRFSRISKFMASTLFDENHGGPYGNTHLAVGKAYHDAYSGDLKKVSEEEYRELGFNSSVEHTDIISTTDRTVTAILKDGSKKVIYEGGEFTLA